MYKNATKCNETIGKWCKTKHGASKIIDTFETYQYARTLERERVVHEVTCAIKMDSDRFLVFYVQLTRDNGI
jgi:hypothetical protein